VCDRLGPFPSTTQAPVSSATGDKSNTKAQEVYASRSFICEALTDLAAGRKVATPTSRPFGCTVAYQGRRMAKLCRSAVLEWNGDVMRGSGSITGGSSLFLVPATFPRVSVDPTGTTTPEEMVAASHAICYGIGMRSQIAQRSGRARRVLVTATITAERAGGIRIQSSHLERIVEGLEGIDAAKLQDIGQATKGAYITRQGSEDRPMERAITARCKRS
jgi:lipoyl-dependent peroxiredoxin